MIKNLTFTLIQRTFFIEILLTKYQPVLVNLLCRRPHKHNLINCIECTFNDGNNFETQGCYLLGEIKINLQLKNRSTHQRSSLNKGVLKNFAKFTAKHLCQSLSFNKVLGLRSATLLKKETLAQVFSCEFCKIFKNTFFTEHHRTTASVKIKKCLKKSEKHY